MKMLAALVLASSLPLAAGGKLLMHHVGACDQCDRPSQGQPRSWCPCPNGRDPRCQGSRDVNCTDFTFDAEHLEAAPLSPALCPAVAPDAPTFCKQGTQDLWVGIPCPAPCNVPPPPPLPPQGFKFHLVASGGAQDVNAIFGYKGLAHMFHQGGSGWMHFISKDYVSWRPLPTIIPPGGWDGSLTLIANANGTATPVILYDCTTVNGCRTPVGKNVGGGSGDPPIVGVARPADPSDPELKVWVKDPRNPIHIDGAPPTYSGPSNLWQRSDGKVDFVMILGDKTGLFQSADPALHNWTLVNPEFFPKRGGGGGMFFPLPDGGGGTSGYTHFLQADYYGDGTGYFALGTYIEDAETFTGVSASPVSIDLSSAFHFVELGYREDGKTLVNSGWVGGVGTSITREIGWDAELEVLTSMPVPEVAALRQKVIGMVGSAVPLGPGQPRQIAASGAAVADLELFVKVPATPVKLTLDICDGAVSLVLEVGVTNRSTGRRTVALGGNVPTMRPKSSFQLKGGESGLAIRALMDTSFVELFVAGGRAMVSAPGAVLAAPGAVTIAADAPGAVLVNATIWSMGSAL